MPKYEIFNIYRVSRDVAIRPFMRQCPHETGAIRNRDRCGFGHEHEDVATSAQSPALARAGGPRLRFVGLRLGGRSTVLVFDANPYAQRER